MEFKKMISIFFCLYVQVKSFQGPEYISLKHTKTNKVLAVLKESDTTEIGFPIWQTPDKKTIRMYLTSKKETLRYRTFEIFNWNIIFNHDKLKIGLMGPVDKPIASPDSIDTWLTLNRTDNTWVPSSTLKVEISDEKEYNKTYDFQQEQTQQGKHPTTEHNQQKRFAHDFLKFSEVASGKVISILKKSSLTVNGAPLWQTPDNKTIRIFLRDSLPCWELLANLRDGSSFNLLGPVGEPKQYPQEVTWHSWNDKTNWTKDGRFSIEESNGSEYENWMLKITQEPQPQNNNEQQPEKQTGGLNGGILGTLGDPKLGGVLDLGVVLVRAGAVGGVGAAGSGIVKGVGGIASGALDLAGQGAGGLFQTAGRGLNSGFSILGLDETGNGLNSAFDDVGSGIQTLGHGVGQGLNDITKGTGDGIGRIAEGVQDIAGIFVGGGSGGIGSGVGGILSGTDSVVSGGIEGAGGVAVGVLDGVGSTSSRILNNVGGGLNSGFSKIGLDGVGNVADNGLRGVGKGLGAVTDTASKGVRKVANDAKKTVSRVRGTFCGIFGC